MKCKACNGKGYCTECIYESDEIGFVDKNYECAVCHGTGQITQTNEEWFCGLSTEEKAEWLSNRDEFIYDCGQKGTTPKIMDKDEWEKWLKEIHNG